MIIIGAGMSGLLAGALNPGATILEAGPDKELNHKALFRCKTPQIGQLLGLPFKEVKVQKAIWLDGIEVQPTPRIIHMYSQKVSGTISARSIFDITSGARYLPPDNFFDRLKERCNIRYDSPFDLSYLYKNSFKEIIISTIPLPKMVSKYGLFCESAFRSKTIHIVRMVIPDCDSHCTIYYPDPAFSAYRASLTGNILTIEGMKKIQTPDIEEIRVSMGLLYSSFPKIKDMKVYRQKQGKILPINERERTSLITQLTLSHRIYSLGRFATWRPKVMLDDVMEDIFVIRRLIEEGNYGSLKHRQGEKS